MKRILILSLCLSTAPAFAEPDIFDRLTGVFDTQDSPESACGVNPIHQSFSADRTRFVWTWDKPYQSYTGAMITANGGTITAVDRTSVTYLRQNETRRGADGAALQWTYHLIDGLDGYCVSYSGQPASNCLFIRHRCSGLAPTS